MVKLQILWEKPQNHLIIIREWPKKTAPLPHPLSSILKSLDNFTTGTFYSSSLELENKGKVIPHIILLTEKLFIQSSGY